MYLAPYVPCRERVGRVDEFAPATRTKNVQAESLTKTLKVEAIYKGGYETSSPMSRLESEIPGEIYNAKRLQSALGYRSLHEFEICPVQQAALI